MPSIVSKYQNGHLRVSVQGEIISISFEGGDPCQRTTISEFTFAQLMGHESGPVRPVDEAHNLLIATHEHLFPLLRLYGEKDDHPVMQAIREYVAQATQPSPSHE